MNKFRAHLIIKCAQKDCFSLPIEKKSVILQPVV